MMGFLKNSNCYLSGAIENDKTAFNWRPEVIKTLTDKFYINVFDPSADPKQNRIAELVEAKEKGDLLTVKKIASAFVRKDLAKIDRSDFVIARIAYERIYISYPPKLRQVPTTGTIHEIINADLYHKPTLVICEHGVKMIPSWLIGFLPLHYLFGNWNNLFKYLQEVDDGKHKEDDRWSYLYGIV